MESTSPPPISGPTELSLGPRRPSVTWTLALWLALAGACLLIFSSNMIGKSAPGPLPDPADVSSPILTFYTRYALGIDQLQSIAGGAAAPGSQQLIESLDEQAGSVIDRLRVLQIIAESAGSDQALTRLDSIDSDLRDKSEIHDPNAPDPAPDAIVVNDAAALEALRRDAATMRAIFEARTADGVPATDRDELLRRHGFFARLALSSGKDSTDPERARLEASGTRTVVFAIAALGIVLLAAIAGLALFIVACAQLANRKLRSGLSHHASRVEAPSYAAQDAMLEAAVVFLWGFVLMSFVAGVVYASAGIDLTLLLASMLATCCFWPLARGWSFAAWRRFIGWHTGAGVFREIACGIVGYLACLPILGVGVLISYIVVMLTGSDASHPIADNLDLSSPLVVLGQLLLAAVWAPLVEETMFRGALHGHLRRTAPILVSALISGFVFAAIHPQGLGGIPALTAMGINFALLREWRGSLIAPITAHAINNFFAVGIMLLVMG